MASNIDPTKPVQGVPTTLSVRDNFLAAHDEIEVLQAADVTHTADIATNVTDIGTNTTDIGTNTTDIATNAAAITVSEGDITALQSGKLDVGAKAADSNLLDALDSTYFRNATNLNAGTVASARMSGSYPNINAGQVDGKSIVVTSSPGSDANTLYFVPE